MPLIVPLQRTGRVLRTLIHPVKHMFVSWVVGRVTGWKDNTPTRKQTSEIGTFEHPQLLYCSTNLIFPYYFTYRRYINELHGRNVCKWIRTWPSYDSRHLGIMGIPKTRICTEDASERRRRLKAEKNLKTGAESSPGQGRLAKFS